MSHTTYIDLEKSTPGISDPLSLIVFTLATASSEAATFAPPCLLGVGREERVAHLFRHTDAVVTGVSTPD